MSDEGLQALGIELLIDRFNQGDKLRVSNKTHGWTGIVDDIWIAPRRLFDSEPTLNVYISYIPHPRAPGAIPAASKTMTVPLDKIDTVDLEKASNSDHDWHVTVSYNKHLVKRNYKR